MSESDLITRDEEIAALKAENRRLRATVEAQEQLGPVRILPLVPETSVTLPSDAQMHELLEAVIGHWPGEFKNVELEMFRRAFFALSTIHRSPEIDQTHYAWHWLAIARERGRGDVNLPAFLAAACAWSDIEMVDFRLENEGVLPAFALSEYCGRLPVDGWRAALAGKFAQLVDPRPRRRVGDGRTPRPSILIDGRRLPDQQRFVGPRYWYDEF